MSHFPVRDLNRVGNIKKKFEGTDRKHVEFTNDIKNTNPSTKEKNIRRTDEENNSRQEENKKKEIETKSDLLQKCSLDVKQNSKVAECTDNIEYAGNKLVSQNTKLGVKRSPAFRCDRIVCGKNVLNVNRGKNNNNNNNNLTVTGNSEVVRLNSNSVALFEQVDQPRDVIRKSTNTLSEIAISPKNFGEQRISNQNIENKNCETVKSTLISKRKDILQKMSSSSKSNEQPPVSYSVVNKKDKIVDVIKEDKNINLKHSDSIKLYLASPLPKGPPPQKPPRTFAHTSHTTIDSNIDDISSKKLDPRKKLDKLENILLNHQKGSHIIVPKRSTNISNEVTETTVSLPPPAKMSLNQHSHSSTDVNIVSCLKNLNCSLVNRDSDAYDKDFSVDKTNLLTDLHKKLSKSSSLGLNSNLKFTKDNAESCLGKTPDSSSKIKADVLKDNQEHIYDIPYKSTPDGRKHSVFSTFGKSIGSEADFRITKNNFKKSKSEEGDLHYMCIKIVEPSLECDHHENTRHMDIVTKPEFFHENFDMKTLSPTQNYKFELYSPAELPDHNVLDITDGSSKTILRPFNLRLHLSKNSRRSGSDSSSVVSESDSTSMPSTPEERRSLENLEQTQVLNGGYSKEIIAAKNNLINIQTAKRKGYLQRVSSRYFCHDASLQYQNKNSSFTHLFECCLIVGLTLSDDNSSDVSSRTKIPYIKSKYPPDANVPPLIESFCFPDTNDWPPATHSQTPEEQYFSIVLTNENGERKFGYCRRVLPEGGHFCLPLAYCIISPYRANGFYYKVLKELESRHGSPESSTFIKQLYNCEFPSPGESLKLNQILQEVSLNNSLTESNYFTTLVRRPSDTRLEERDLTHLLETLKLPVFLKLFSSLLLERKVLLLSSSLRTLSSCIEALQSILHPFSWQHCYIPVLPAHLVEICEAPTPYIIGLLKAKEGSNVVANLSADEAIIVDLDDSKIIYSCKDEGSILPSQARKNLKSKLSSVASETHEGSRNLKISEAFIKLFVDLCGHYTNCISTDNDANRIFNKDLFIRNAPSRDIQSFLEWFTDTAMFHAFVEETLQAQSDGVLERSWSIVQKPEKLKKTRTLGERFKDLTAPFK